MINVWGSVFRAGFLLLSLLLSSEASVGAAGNPCSNRFFKDLDPNLKGETQGITSPRFMRRMWIHDGYLLVLIQQGGYEGRFLSLYRVRGQGPNDWQFVDNVAGASDPDQYLSGDGFLLPGGDLILVVSSRQALFPADVHLYRYEYQGGGNWTPDLVSPVNVIRYAEELRHFNATLALDSMNRMFVSYIKVDGGNFAVRYSYSNDGLEWVEAEKAFTLSDGNERKSARVSTVRVGGENAVALVYHDHDEAGEYLRWNYRLDSEPLLEAGWVLNKTSPPIRAMPASHPSMYRHWSLARDAQGGLHLSWEEPDGIHYSRYDGDPEGRWDVPTFLVDGVYSNVTTSVGNGESFVYVFADDQRNAIVGAAYDPVVEGWTRFYRIGSPGLGGHRRVSSPEQFIGGAGARLPVLYQNENDPKAPATQLLFSVLLDCK